MTISRDPSARDELASVVALAKRLFPRPGSVSVSRVMEGASTRVYRIPSGDETLYLRILPEEEGSFAPEVYAHALLRERGVKAPEVVHWEHRNSDLGRSIMVTTEIKGQSLSHAARELSALEVRGVLIEAGRDLALINGVPVGGFGWVRRDAPTHTQLEAERPTFRAFALEFLDADLAHLLEWQVLDAAEVAAIRAILARLDGWLDVPQGFLVHGDLDVSHIFVHNGRYSGIIDFGEIRSADPLYDLAHFSLHDGETLVAGLLAPLIEGYTAVQSLPDDYPARLSLLALLMGTRALARRLGKRGQDAAARHLVAALRRELVMLRSATSLG